MRFLALLFVVGTLVQQQPGIPDDQLPESERRIPMGHYCKRPDVAIGPRETRAHHCDCTMSCTVDEQGNVTTHESSNCMAYCEKNGRRCTCHVEAPCPKEGSNALIDMDGHIVAMALRKRP